VNGGLFLYNQSKGVFCMEVDHKEFLESQLAMSKMIMTDLKNLGEDEPVFAIKLDIDDIGKNLIVNYWYAKDPEIDDYFPEDANELIEEHEEMLEKLDELTKQKPESVVAMTLLELLNELTNQLELYRIRIVD
jgi:hypothetical protein